MGCLFVRRRVRAKVDFPERACHADAAFGWDVA